MVSDRFGNGWLFSYAENLACHALLLSDNDHDVSNELLPCSYTKSKVFSIHEAIRNWEYEYAGGRRALSNFRSIPSAPAEDLQYHDGNISLHFPHCLIVYSMPILVHSLLSVMEAVTIWLSH